MPNGCVGQQLFHSSVKAPLQRQTLACSLGGQRLQDYNLHAVCRYQPMTHTTSHIGLGLGWGCGSWMSGHS